MWVCHQTTYLEHPPQLFQSPLTLQMISNDFFRGQQLRDKLQQTLCQTPWNLEPPPPLSPLHVQTRKKDKKWQGTKQQLYEQTNSNTTVSSCQTITFTFTAF